MSGSYRDETEEDVTKLVFSGILSSFHHGTAGLVICIPLDSLEAEQDAAESMAAGPVGTRVMVTVETDDRPEEDNQP